MAGGGDNRPAVSVCADQSALTGDGFCMVGRARMENTAMKLVSPTSRKINRGFLSMALFQISGDWLLTEVVMQALWI
tara:strand:- start:5354 stop:5584 length:231 start_codon:yes stop_codon:yes gene_type:complete